MSIGFYGRASLVESDESTLFYSYACCDINRREIWREVWEKEDGELWISRDALIEPEIHEKIRRMPSGRKRLVVKRVPHWPPVEELIDSGKIMVKNAAGTWTMAGSVDRMAIRLLDKIFMEYQIQGEIPQLVSVFY